MKIVHILLIIILGLLIYLAFKPSGDGMYLDAIKQQFKEYAIQRDSLDKFITFKLDNIEIVEKKETFIRNYYNEIINATDTITTDISAIYNIRKWLDSLGSARLIFNPERVQTDW